MLKMGDFSSINHVIPSNISTLNPSARARPSLLATGCFDVSRSLETNDIKIMLSMPNTISKNVNVTRESSPEAVNSASI